jgi:hypothetical protein
LHSMKAKGVGVGESLLFFGCWIWGLYDWNKCVEWTEWITRDLEVEELVFWSFSE